MGFGPGAGIGFTYPLPKDFSINASIVLLNMFGKYSSERRTNYHDLPYGTAFIIPEEVYAKYAIIGLDNRFSVGYFIRQIKTTVSLGFRYQMLYHISMGGKGSIFDLNYNEDWIDGEADHMYGLTFSAVYNF